MNFDASCQRAEQILTGTLDTTALDSMTTALLDSFTYLLDGEVAVEPTLDEAAFLGKIRVWKERTSTSPLTGIHLGHAKAYIADTNLLKHSPEWETFQKDRAKILRGHLVLLNYALQFGHSFPRWKSIVNAMLEKDPGNPRIHRLRVIHLYEWDFNLILCVKWRQLLHHVVDNGLLNPACYGTTPGHSSLDPVFIQELEYEVARLTRRPMIHFDNDATSCYDRIPCFLANLASRKYGMHKKVCIVQARTLEAARYYLKTKLGISDEYAEHTRECPWFGTGQGSGNSPFYWLLISSTLYDLYCAKTTGGATYSSPDKSVTVRIHLLGFVDDVKNRTNLWTAANSALLATTLDQLIAQATKDSQLWHDILTTANQELELTKCKYHFIHFEFDENGSPSMVDDPNPQQPQYPLTIQGKDNQPVRITYIPSSQAIKYLGCQKCPANQDQQYQALLKKCNDYARVINCSQLSRRGVQVFYQAIYRLSVTYPLPVCYFSFEQLDRLQRRAHRAIVNGCGYNRNTKKAVLYGPSHLQGAGFFHLYDEQGYGQVAHFIKAWRTPHTHAGQMLRVAVSWAQYAAGTSWSIFRYTVPLLPHLESTWLASMRQYLKAVNGFLELDTPFIPTLQRRHDIFFMDAVLRSGQFTPGAVKRINYCRLYLRVITLADICNANGTRITKAAYQGDSSAIINNSDWYHIHQVYPGSRAWAQWRRACRLFCNTATDLALKEPMEEWTVDRNHLRRQWPFWHVPGTNIVYKRQVAGTYSVHRRMRHDFDNEPIDQGVDLPTRAVPVDGKLRPSGVIQIQAGYNQWAIPPLPAPPSTSIKDHIASLALWERVLLRGFDFLAPKIMVFHKLTDSPLLIASDGSYQSGKASFGWIISDADGNRLISCSGPCFGASLNSYRAEGYGILSVVRFLYHLRHQFQIDMKPCTIYCDNQAMVARASAIPIHLNEQYPNRTLEPEWDIINQIWRTNSTIPEGQAVSIRHIKGHQDQKKPYHELPIPAQLNCQADKLAADFITNHPNMPYHKAPLIANAGTQLHLSTGTISAKLHQELRLARTTKPLEDHLQDKFNWDADTFASIDWESSRRAYRRLQKHRLTLIKHANNITPTGVRVNRYDPKYPPECPSCPVTHEEANHIHQCQCPERVAVKTKILSDLRKKMDALNTAAPLMDLMMEGLKSVFDSRDPDTIPVPTALVHVAAAQEQIGWEHILRGRISNLWAKTQQDHLGAFDPRKNGQTWATDIIQLLLEGWMALWKQRNEDRHGKDRATRVQIEKAQAIRELQQLYELKDGVPERHRWLFDTPLLARMNMKTHQIRAYINTWKPILIGSYNERQATG